MTRPLPLVAFALLAAIASSAAVATVAYASFTSTRTAAGGAISTRNLLAPGSLTATPSGHNVAVSWTAGSNGSGYKLLAAANGASSNCSAASFANLTATASLTYTDSGRYTPQGMYECYQVETTYNSWYSVSGNPTAAAQLGFVAAGVAVTNGGGAGKLDTGDTVVVTYNQAVNTATGPSATDNVCTDTGTNTIVLGSTGAGTTCATGPVTLGTITGITVNKKSRYAATWTWNAAHTALTITIGANTAGSAANITGTGSFGPTTTATGMLSTTGAFHNCDTNTGGANCLPTPTGGF
jgi:hypothetical protein